MALKQATIAAGISTAEHIISAKFQAYGTSFIVWFLTAYALCKCQHALRLQVVGNIAGAMQQACHTQQSVVVASARQEVLGLRVCCNAQTQQAVKAGLHGKVFL